MIVCECGCRFNGVGSRVTCPTCGIEYRAIAVADVCNIAISAHIVVVKRDGDRDVGVRMTGDSGRDISADLQPSGQIASSISARPRPNEQNVPEVARIFREHLNCAGATWKEPEICARVSAKQENGIDFILRDGASSLYCQVVRPPCEKTSLWSQIARGRTVQTTQDPAEAAEELRKAIEKKSKLAARDSITLVIDSIETPALALKDVLREFRRSCGDWARSLGFEGIWVVGPTSDLTTRLA